MCCGSRAFGLSVRGLGVWVASCVGEVVSLGWKTLLHQAFVTLISPFC